MHAAIVTGVSRGLGEALAAGDARPRASRCWASAARRARGSRASATISPPAISPSRRSLAAAVTPALRVVAAGKPESVTLDQQRGGRHADRTGRATSTPARSPPRSRTNAAAPAVMADLFLRSFPTTRSSAGSSTSRRARRRPAIAGTLVYWHVEGGARDAHPRHRGRVQRPAVSLHLAAARHFRDRHAGVHAKPRSGRSSRASRCFAASRTTGY